MATCTTQVAIFFAQKIFSFFLKKSAGKLAQFGNCPYLCTIKIKNGRQP
jgi:hypothetical protein